VLATASTDGGARAWDLDTGELLLPPTVHAPEAVRATFRPGGKMLASAGTDGRVRFASLESDARPPAELTDRARLLAGAEVRGEGTVPLDAEALRVIWARLGGKH
jgi:WD40 repeat protein